MDPVVWFSQPVNANNGAKCPPRATARLAYKRINGTISLLERRNATCLSLDVVAVARGPPSLRRAKPEGVALVELDTSSIVAIDTCLLYTSPSPRD